MEEERLKRKLLKLAHRYSKHTGRGLETVSRNVHGDTWFLRDFSEGKISCTLKKYDAMVDLMTKGLEPDTEIVLGKVVNGTKEPVK